MSPIVPGIVGSSDGRQPDTPPTPSASAGNAQATVTFSAPAYLGKPNTNNLYTVTSNPGSLTATGTASPLTVTGLINGTAYTFTVTLRTRDSANNTIAISLPSAASNSVTPIAPPSFFAPPLFFAPPGFFAPPLFFAPPGFFAPPLFFAPPGFFSPPLFFSPPGFFSPPSFFSPPLFFSPPGFFSPPAFFAPPKFAIKCIHKNARILTTRGYMFAKDIKIGDKVLTVSANNITNINPTLHNMSISNNVEFVEVEVTTNIVSQKPLVKFNDIDDMFSPNQPIYVKTESGIDWKQTGEVSLGDMLVRVDEITGDVSYIPVQSIENFDADDVHEIRTTPHLWFIVGNYLVVS